MTGEPTFFEMGVADTARARAFYSGLFGWRLEPGPSAGGYRISTPTIPGGMHGNDEGAGALVFFGVPDLEAAMARVRDLGGHDEALESRADEPREGSFGRFALCRDDQGSPFGLHQPLEAEGKGAREPAARKPTIDHVTLRARDLPASRRFYEAALAPPESRPGVRARGPPGLRKRGEREAHHLRKRAARRRVPRCVLRSQPGGRGPFPRRGAGGGRAR
jgi:uncharacterized protein